MQVKTEKTGAISAFTEQAHDLVLGQNIMYDKPKKAKSCSNSCWPSYDVNGQRRAFFMTKMLKVTIFAELLGFC